MIYYLGETFDKEKNKTYKTLEGGKKAADQKGLNLYDEDGKLVHKGKESEEDVQKLVEAPEGNREENPAQVTEKGEEMASGEEEELVERAGEQSPDVTKVHGKIRRIFDGLLRIRKSPSWDKSACIGVTKFVEKDVVALHLVDGRPMYETLDGYFITADEKLVKYIEK